LSTVVKSFGISQFSIQSAGIKESSMESKHFVVKCSLKIAVKVVNSHALIDCVATGIAFVDKDFVPHHQLEEKELKESRELEVIDGRPIESGTITTMARLNIGIRSHQEQLPAFITKLGYYLIVLGLPWLQLHAVTIKFRSHRIGFESSYCQLHCQHHSSIWGMGQSYGNSSRSGRTEIGHLLGCSITFFEVNKTGETHGLRRHTVQNQQSLGNKGPTAETVRGFPLSCV
jgi:hypothetical protein